MRRVVLVTACLLAGCPGEEVDKDDTDAGETDSHTDGPVDTDETDVPETDVAETDTEVPVDPCLTEATVVHLGYGDYEYTALTADQDVNVTRGSQAPNGIWHFPVAFEAEHVTERVVASFRVLRRSDGQPILKDDPYVLRQLLVPPDGPGDWQCTGRLWGGTAVLDPVAAGWPNDTDADRWQIFCGLPVTVELELRAPAAPGTEGPLLGTASVDVVLQPAPQDGEPCLPE